MKKLLFFSLIVLTSWSLWSWRHAALVAMQGTNARLGQEIATLKARQAELDDARRLREVKLATETSHQLVEKRRSAASAATTPIAVAPADPNRHGGWPAGGSFVYLPKELLTKVGYRVTQGERLTDEASRLFGLSSGETEQVNAALSHLLESFRDVERQRMQPIDPPENWNTFKHDSAVAVKIPALTADLDALRQDFQTGLTATLGDTRGQLLGDALGNTFDARFESLGKDERVVGFMWQPESDGSRSLWFGRGDGSFARVMENPDPDSPLVYYANLLGVQLPP